jgi:queuine/archaeosine tRNA-ribosyltransferase
MLTLHNVTFYQTLMASARAAIERDAFDAFASAFKARYRDRTAPGPPHNP